MNELEQWLTHLIISNHDLLLLGKKMLDLKILMMKVDLNCRLDN